MTSTAEPDPLLGRTIAGKYAITSFIGDGAMGSVYRATHLALETPVAIKVLKAHSNAVAFGERFRREAQAASRLDHPNSVRVIDYGQEPDGLLYLVMELLEGRELLTVIEYDFPLSTKRIVSILSQALAAIAVAHDQKVVHRDLKPENIMIMRRADDDGAEVDLVKVCDFGIAKLQHAETTEGRRLTTQGEVIGTPEFMSPEQARGEELDARSDLYSMGVILFEMLTGRAPFESDTALGLALMQVNDPPPAPSKLQPRVDPILERVCLKAMAKRREDRYQTAREMRLELRSAVAPGDAPVVSARGERPEKNEQADTLPPDAPVKMRRADTIATDAVVASTPPRDRRTRGVLLALLALVVVGGAAIGVMQLSRSDRAKPTASSTAPATSSSNAPSVTAAPTPSITAAPEPTVNATPQLSVAAKTIATAAPKMAATATATMAATVVAPPPPTSDPVPTTTATAVATTTSTTPATPAAPPPTTTPPPATATTVAAAAAPPFDPSGARATIASATATNGVSGSNVRASLNVEAISRCYRDALKAKGAPASGNATLQLSIDDGGRVTSAILKGADFLPGMKGCIEGVARLAKIKGVDTGDSIATIGLAFTAK